MTTKMHLNKSHNNKGVGHKHPYKDLPTGSLTAWKPKLNRLIASLKSLGNNEEAEKLRQMMKELDEDAAWMGLDDEDEPSDAPKYQPIPDDPTLHGQLVSEEEFDELDKQENKPNIEAIESWLIEGIMMNSIHKRAPIGFKDFIHSNINILKNFGNPQYIGSGATGDAWKEGHSGGVLKIFDANAFSNASNPPYLQYLKFYESMHIPLNQDIKTFTTDKGLENIPMIYGVGLFNTPFSISKMSFSNFSHGGTKLAWVVMEKLITPDEMLSRYIKDSENTLEPEKSIDDEEEAGWVTEDNPDFKLAEIYDIYEKTPDLQNSVEQDYGGDWSQAPVSTLLKTLIHAVITSIISNVALEYYILTETTYQYADDKDEYDSEEDWIESQLDLKDPKVLRRFVEREVEQQLNSEDVIGGVAALDLVERVLGINTVAKEYNDETIIDSTGKNNWLIDVVLSGMRRMLEGYGDIHSGNFGFRKEWGKRQPNRDLSPPGNRKEEELEPINRPIFFDS